MSWLRFGGKEPLSTEDEEAKRAWELEFYYQQMRDGKSHLGFINMDTPEEAEYMWSRYPGFMEWLVKGMVKGTHQLRKWNGSPEQAEAVRIWNNGLQVAKDFEKTQK